MVSFRSALRVSSVMLVCAAASAAPSSAQSVSRSAVDRISVEAQSLPIGRVLRDMLAVAPIEALMIDPKVENHPVSARLLNVSAGEAINQILADSNLPFLVWGGAQGPWRIFVGDKDAALRVTSGSPLPNGGVATPQTVEAQERVLEAERREIQAAEESKSAEAMAQRQAEAEPVVIMDDPGVPGGYTMIGESVIYNDPTFVPYKNREEVRARRLATDVALIP
jgi:hypothetical protein